MSPKVATHGRKGFLSALFDIRPGETERAFLLFANLFLTIASFYILKPVRSSVFLVSFGPEQLPYVFILIALIGGGLASVYSNFSSHYPLNRLIIASSIAVTAILVLFRLLLRFDEGWVSYAFYIFISLYAVITTSQFWLLANNLFDAREARRLFGFIGAGGILGSIAGAAVASTLASSLRVENLILIAALLIGLSIPITARAWPLGIRLAPGPGSAPPPGSSMARRERASGMREIFGLIRRSPHLALLIGIIALTVVASTLVDYMFSKEAYDHFAARVAREQTADLAAAGQDLAPEQLQETIDRQVKAELTRFFARFLGLVSTVSLVLQVGLAGRILGAIGVAGANLLMPLGLLAAASGMWFFPGLVTVASARLVDGALSYSIHRAGTELLFFPLPSAIKDRTKTFIDLFADRMARGIAGALLLILTGIFALHTRGLAAVLAVIIALWLFLLGRMRGEYLSAFRRAIAGRTLDIEEIRNMVRSPDAIRTLASGLAGDERQVAYTLALLESADSNLLVPHLVPLLAHPSPEVRRLAMRKLAASEDADHRGQVAALLEDPSRHVRREAVRYLARTAPEGAEGYLRALLAAADWRARGAALEVIADDAQEGRDGERLQWIDGPLLDSLLAVGGSGHADACAAVLRAIAALGPGTPHASRLEPLLNHPDPTVRSEAMAAAGEVRDPRHLTPLLAALENPRERPYARPALARYGEALLPLLGAVLDDETADLGVRVQIPGTIGLMQTQPAVDFLLDRLRHPRMDIRFQVIKALGKMRVRDRDRRLRFDPHAVEARLVEETRDYFDLQTALAVWNGGQRGAAAPPGALLSRALGERIDMNLERIFRILGLRYPTENMLFAYNGVISDRRALRASAIEFLDNLLSPQLKRVILPVAAESDPRALVQRGRELFQLTAREREDVLRQVITGGDSWLAACAIDAVQELGLREFDAEIGAHHMSRDPILRETAAAALGSGAPSAPR